MHRLRPTGARRARGESILSRSAQRLLCAAIALVATALLAETSKASLIIFNGPVTIPPASLTGVFINLETGASTTIDPGSSNPPPWANFWGTSANRLWFYPTASATNRAVANGTAVAVLGVGNPIGPGNPYLATATSGSPMSPAGTTWNSTAGFDGYVGYKFLNTAGTQTLYGWAQVHFNAWPNSTTPGGGTVLRWAYEDSGNSTTIPPVPEPASLTVVSLGALGIMSRRRR